MNKKTLTLILRIIVSISLLGFLLYKSNIAELISILDKVNYPYFGLAVSITIIGLTISALKWKILLGLYDHHISYKKLLNIYWSALFFNNFLPSTIGGDVYRITALSKLSKSRFYSVLTVFLDRFTGAIALTSVAIISLTFTYKLLGENANILLAIIAFLILAIVLVFCEKAIEKILPVIKILRVANPSDKINNLKESIGILKRDKILFIKVMLLSLFFQGLAIIVSWIIAMALNFNVPFFYFMIFSPVIMFISMIPVGLSGLGVRETATVVLYTSVKQLTEPQALLLSLTGYFVILIVSLGGILTYAIYVRTEEIKYEQTT